MQMRKKMASVPPPPDGKTEQSGDSKGGGAQTGDQSNGGKPTHDVTRDQSGKAAGLTEESQKALVALIRYSASKLETDVTGEAAGVYVIPEEFIADIMHQLKKLAAEKGDPDNATIDNEANRARKIIEDFLNESSTKVHYGGGGGDGPLELNQGGEG